MAEDQSLDATASIRVEAVDEGVTVGTVEMRHSTERCHCGTEVHLAEVVQDLLLNGLQLSDTSFSIMEQRLLQHQLEAVLFN